MKPRIAVLSLFASLALFSPRASAQGELWVVDWVSGPGSDFGTIQAAVDAAAEGDAILVRSGIYDRFEIDGKSLAVVAEDDGGTVQVRNTSTALGDWVRIANLGADQSVLVAGLDVQVLILGSQSYRAPIALRDNAGAVLLEGVRVRGFPTGVGSVEITGCASATLVRCLMEGGVGGGPALFVEDSAVALYDSHFYGADGLEDPGGIFAPCEGGSTAGHGALVRDSSLVAVGCSFQGGNGGKATTPSLHQLGAPGGRGGDGVQLDGSSFEWRDSSFAQGFGGLASPTCPSGPDGLEVNPGPASNHESGASARALAADSPLREGELATLRFEGEPFDFIYLSVSPENIPALALAPPFVGLLHLGSPSFVFKFGLLPITGSKSVPVTLSLGAGTDFALLYLQSTHVGFGGEFVVGNPTALLVVDDAF